MPFKKYCSPKNPEFWLVEKFLGDQSTTKKFPNTRFPKNNQDLTILYSFFWILSYPTLYTTMAKYEFSQNFGITLFLFVCSWTPNCIAISENLMSQFREQLVTNRRKNEQTHGQTNRQTWIYKTLLLTWGSKQNDKNMVLSNNHFHV